MWIITFYVTTAKVWIKPTDLKALNNALFFLN